MQSKIQPTIEDSWKEILIDEFQKEYFGNLKSFLQEEKKQYTIYPSGNKIFAAFDYTPIDKVKVVIIGQDPYHGPNQANGLCFSVSEGIKAPPSLVNIFKEIKSDLGFEIPNHGNLEHWAKQGVLLLNSVLTVRKSQAGSHQNKGWEIFTNQVIKTISDKKENIVFLLWGNYAKQKAELINQEKHFILNSVHPSPFSARNGFFGCKHFSKTNQYLEKKNIKPIDWNLNL